MGDWRKDEATSAQCRRLKEEGIAFSKGISKGEASDLISQTCEASDEVIKKLKFFNCKASEYKNEYLAQQKLSEILSDDSNVEKWESRPANKDQKEVYKFFNLPIPKALKFKAAELFISDLLDDDEKAEAWENYEDALYDREEWFEDTLDEINDEREMFECKKITKALFKQVVA
jgi:hypothetical protein